MAKYYFFSPTQLKPEGWLKKQLLLQANALSGNLDKIWKDVKESAWIGGTAEGWERVPYWLDGFIPLAYLLEDKDMINRAKKYVDSIISLQDESGWICPCKKEDIQKYDTWAVILISKVLTVYYNCSNDERIPSVLYKALKNYYDLLNEGKIKLFDWGKYRWFEAFIAIDFLLKTYDEKWLYDLAEILKNQGQDYLLVTKTWERPLNKWTFYTHIVNICMALKAEALVCEVLKTPYKNQAQTLIDVLNKYNGTPVGLWTGDECLSGLSPIQGTELCAVVEQMFSYEMLFVYTGESHWAELLEVVAFNALPATISEDMWTHQYVQMSNQIACQKFPGKSLFRTNGEEAHLFGLEPNFGCCTANFNQGWPKFALSAFMKDINGNVINALPLPSTLSTRDYKISLTTDYPFKNSFVYKIEAYKDFTFEIRIPTIAKNLTVNGEKIKQKGNLTIELKKGERKTVEVSYDFNVQIMQRPHNLKSIKCGSLIFALPILCEKVMHEYERNGVERKFPYCDYEYLPKSDWNYAFCAKDFTIERNEVGDIPFSSENPPVKIKTKMLKINWEYEDGYDSVCAKYPKNLKPIDKTPQEKELYPYGCAKLRMTEMPFIKRY